MNDPQDDKLLNLYRQSRLEQPSAEMDTKIVQAAKRALYRKRNRWLWALSTAAVIVISFNVVFELSFMDEQITELDTLLEIKKPTLPSTGALPEEPLMIERLDEQEDLQLEDQLEVLNEAADHVAQPVMNRLLQTDGAGQQVETDRDSFKSIAKPKLQAVEKERKTGLKNDQKKLDIKKLEMKKRENAKRLESAAPSSAMAPRPIIPELPSTLDQLLALNAYLIGQQSNSGLITLYSQDKLILTVKSEQGLIHYKAWPGSEIIGIRLDWKMSPAELKNCRHDTAFTICDLTNGGKALFEENRLDHISWTRPDE